MVAMETTKNEKALLLRFNITQTVHIRLTKLKVSPYLKHKAKPYKCQVSQYSSKFKCDVTKHLRTHTGEKRFACPLCNYKCYQRSNLNNHIITHTGEKYYSCSSCKKSFGLKTQKLFHEKSCKQISRPTNPSWIEAQKIFKCKLCPHSTANKYSLKRHVMIHTGEKPFSCALCNRMFTFRTDLQRHIFSHTREKPHSCPFCKGEFAKRSDEKKHEKICKLNPKQGDAKWVEEQKKFKCQLCKYRSTTKGNLESHLRACKGKKKQPFNCPLCFHAYSQIQGLHRHLKQVHVTEKGYNCPDNECDFITLLTSKLLNHVKEFHEKSSTC